MIDRTTFKGAPGMSEPLPSSFDLWFDIKTREALVARYADLRQELAQIEGLMAFHGMEFTSEEMAVIEPEPPLPPAVSGPQPT